MHQNLTENRINRALLSFLRCATFLVIKTCLQTSKRLFTIYLILVHLLEQKNLSFHLLYQHDGCQKHSKYSLSFPPMFTQKYVFIRHFIFVYDLFLDKISCTESKVFSNN